MTDQQINRIIAEACGWKGNLICPDMEGNLWPSEPPNYCDDLNAMHEVENVLMHADMLFEYAMHISIDHRYDYLLIATARQRAEAFLRLLGKWEATDKESLTVQPTAEQSLVVQPKFKNE